MGVLDNHISRLSNKLQQLLKHCQHLQKENERMKAVVKKLENDNEVKAGQLDLLQQQLGILRAAAGQMNDSDKKAFEKKLNQYLKDIDKCITLLSE